MFLIDLYIFARKYLGQLKVQDQPSIKNIAVICVRIGLVTRNLKFLYDIDA